MSLAELVRVADRGIHLAPPTKTAGARLGNTSRAVLAFCAEPRTMDDILGELGDSAKFTVWNLVKHGKLKNLNGPRQKGLFVVPEHAKALAALPPRAPRAPCVKTGRATARETLTWHRTAGRQQLPDADATVLIRVLNPDGEPVWLGFHDGESWRYADGAPVGRTVLAWADMPGGPEA